MHDENRLDRTSGGKTMSLLGIIPARAGSKGIPKKNLQIIGSKPLIEYTLEQASQVTDIDYLLLSTDAPEIIHLAKKFPKVHIPFLRPSNLARDNTPMIDVLKHCINRTDNPESYTDLLLLQPTSPFRTAEHINQAIKIYRESDADTLVSVTHTEQHPSWSYWLKKQQLEPILSSDVPSQRHDLPEVVSLNGAIYLTKINLIVNENKIIGKKISFSKRQRKIKNS